MLAISPFFNQFLPIKPSPLSPRSANIHGSHRRPGTMASSTNENDVSSTKAFGASPAADSENQPMIALAPSTTSPSDRIPFSQRRVKVAPGLGSRELREQRRGAYLRRVRDGRDDKRFEVRGDDMMRLDFVQKRREWEAEQARMAIAMAGDFFEDEENYDEAFGDENHAELPTWGGSQMQISSQVSARSRPEEEVEDFLRDEQSELEALLEFMPGREAEGVPNGDDSDGMWSDDVDYDELFFEVIGRTENGAQSNQNMDTGMGEGEEMDMT